MTEIKIIVPGKPEGKGVARVFHHKQLNRMMAMTPEKTSNYMALIQHYAMLQRPAELLDEPLELEFVAYSLKPKAAKKRKYPTVKPDLSNIQKGLEDALSGIIFRDDALIVSVISKKRYTDNEPRLEIFIRKMSEYYA